MNYNPNNFSQSGTGASGGPVSPGGGNARLRQAQQGQAQSPQPGRNTQRPGQAPGVRRPPYQPPQGQTGQGTRQGGQPVQNAQNGRRIAGNPYADSRNGGTADSGIPGNVRGQNQNLRENGRQGAGQTRYTPAGQGSGGQDHIQFRRSTRVTDRNRMIIFAIIALLVITGIIIAVSAMNYRPGQSMDLGWGVVEGDEYHETTTDDGRPARNADGAVPATYTRSNPSKYNFLIVGKDHVASNTDVVWLVSFDVDSGSASVLQIPRDTMIRESGYDRRINRMYSIHYNAAVKRNRNGESDEWVQSGMEGLVADIERNMCVAIDYWAFINLDGFGEIVDALGGVEIDVPYALDYEDPYQDLYIHIKEGPQVMDGATAQGFMRFRSGYVQGDIGRVSAQKIMITALLKTFREKFTVFMITDLAKVIFRNVKTNMQFADIGYLGRKALGVDLSSMVMMTLPGEATQASSGAWYYIMRRADTLFLVNRYFNVFDQPITESDFDRDQLFNDGKSKRVMNIYLTPQADDPVAKYVTSGQMVDENSIKIDLVPETTAEETTSPPEEGQ